MDFSFLQGKKTYLVAALIGVVAAARHLGWLDEATFQTLMALLAGGGFAALRSGVSKQ